MGIPGYGDIHSAFVSCAGSLQTARLQFAPTVLCLPTAVGERELVHGREQGGQQQHLFNLQSSWQVLVGIFILVILGYHRF